MAILTRAKRGIGAVVTMIAILCGATRATVDDLPIVDVDDHCPAGASPCATVAANLMAEDGAPFEGALAGHPMVVSDDPEQGIGGTVVFRVRGRLEDGAMATFGLRVHFGAYEHFFCNDLYLPVIAWRPGAVTVLSRQGRFTFEPASMAVGFHNTVGVVDPDAGSIDYRFAPDWDTHARVDGPFPSGDGRVYWRNGAQLSRPREPVRICHRRGRPLRAPRLEGRDTRSGGSCPLARPVREDSGQSAIRVRPFPDRRLAAALLR